MDQFDLGRPVSLRETREWRQNPPPQAQFKANGRTPDQRMEQFERLYEQAIRGKQHQGYDGLRGQAEEKYEFSASTLNEIQKDVAAWLKGLRQGTLSADEVQKNVAQAVSEAMRVASIIESVKRDEEAATAMIDMEPEDYEQTLLERFPALSKSLPVITEAWLLGEEGAPDPLGGA